MAPQDSENCGRNFAKRKQSDAEFAGKRLLRMVIIYGVISGVAKGVDGGGGKIEIKIIKS